MRVVCIPTIPTVVCVVLCSVSIDSIELAFVSCKSICGRVCECVCECGCALKGRVCEHHACSRKLFTTPLYTAPTFVQLAGALVIAVARYRPGCSLIAVAHLFVQPWMQLPNQLLQQRFVHFRFVFFFLFFTTFYPFALYFASTPCINRERIEHTAGHRPRFYLPSKSRPCLLEYTLQGLVDQLIFYCANTSKKSCLLVDSRSTLQI